MADKSSVDKLKEKLYSRAAPPVVEPSARTPLSPRQGGPIRSAWSGLRALGAAPESEAGPAAGDLRAAPPAPPLSGFPFAQGTGGGRSRHHTFALYFLWGSVAFFVIASGIAVYMLFGGGNTISSSNIDMQIVAPSLIDSGKSMTIEYVVGNRNSAPLRAADLVIDYPDGTRDPNNTSQPLQHERITIGDIQSGQQVKETSTAAFFGAEGAQEQVSVTLEYQIPGSNTIFIKQSNVMFTIGSAPILLSVASPSEAISGQPFTMDITISSNATTPIQNVAIEAQYPFGFSVVSTSPAADVGNTLWRLGTLDPGASETVHLTGTLTGADGDERVMHFLVGSESDPTETALAVPMLSIPQTITVRKPFVSGQLTLDGQTGDTIAEPLGKTLEGSVAWQNNLTESVSNLVLTLSLSGTAVDPSSVSAVNGFYDSTKNQIIWSNQQNPAFSNVGPGASGNVQFYFSTLAPSAARPLTNPQITLTLTVDASRQAGSAAPGQVSSAAHMTVNLASAASLSAQALHFAGPLSNTGPMPPVAGTETTYTVLWTVKNSSNTVASSKVSATLPPYVDFVGASTAGNEQVSYDSPSRTVTWTLGDVKAGTGYTLPVRQAAFQVAFTPSLSQVGSAPALTSDATFSGTDRFAQAQVAASAPAVTTRLTTDSGFQAGMDIVGK